MTLYGTIDSSSRTSASLRPMKRLIEKTVLVGLVTAWRLATVPTRRSPLCVKATTDGVVRPPSLFSITVGSPALEHGHARVRGSEVDSDGLCHVVCSSTRSQSAWRRL